MKGKTSRGAPLPNADQHKAAHRPMHPCWFAENATYFDYGVVLKHDFFPPARRHSQNSGPKGCEPRFEDYVPGMEKLKPRSNYIFADGISTDGFFVSLFLKKQENVPQDGA